jgi:hypothetical protein
MKITKKHKIPKKTIVTIAALLILGGVGGLGLYRSQQPSNSAGSTAEVRPQNTVDYNPPSATEQQQKDDTKAEVIKNSDEQSKAASTDASTAGTADANANTNISVTISRASQGGNGLPLNIRTIIVGANSGTCTVNLTRSGQPTVTKTFDIVTQATYSTCQQADIAAADFSTDGEWQLSITATNNSGTSQPVTGSVKITK